MLKHLHIKNFTLIDQLDIDFNGGFSVITGETGAGKSIILGAIGLLLGQRADSKAIRNAGNKCVIEAHFDISAYDDMGTFFANNDIDEDTHDCIIRRELSPGGKSRAFINDTPVALSTLKELTSQLIDIHSQHQNLLLAQHDFQLDVIDIIANDQEQLANYRKAFDTYRETERELEKLRQQAARNQENADFIQFQFDELSNAHLTDGEQDELEQQAAIMSHSEEIKENLYKADGLLSSEGTGIVEQLRATRDTLASLEQLLPEMSEMARRADSCHIELKDLAQEISGRLEDTDFDPSELEAINNRLDKIYDLEKKYHCDSVAGLIAARDSLRQQLSDISNSDEQISELVARLEEERNICLSKASALSKKRALAARRIEKDMLDRLVTLGMPNVKFVVSVTPREMDRSGADRVSFLFSANKSGSPQPVSQVASGGEIARVMLSLKAMISSAVKLPTIIFDEIDTGVSGKIAERMAQIMQQMGECGRQVISITHLPQIAALGATHYKVEKTETAKGTSSRMRILGKDERIIEIAQMLSGSNITEAAVSNAKELLKQWE